MVQSLISQSPDIQKILAFSGAFERLFHTIAQEGGVEGGIITQDALACVEGLFRYNSSNQVSMIISPNLVQGHLLLLELLPRNTSSAGSMLPATLPT
jgi:hypothetical protein